MAHLDRNSILGKTWDCACGQVHSVPVKRALIEEGAIDKSTHVLKGLGINGRIFLLADEITYDVAGRRLEGVLKKSGYDIHLQVLSGRPCADIQTAEDAADALERDDVALVSCGSGTITDIGKWVASKNSIPQVVVATAPSMNGYVSGIVALERDGLKTTEAVRPPVAVIADVNVLSQAPLEMIMAGLGDLLSKPVCNADWRLASLVRNEHFCSVPFELVHDLEGLYTDRAGCLAVRDKKIIRAMTEALIFSGISMVIAGSSAPASGAEHLISHFLDMRAVNEGRRYDLHGAQVGVATIATARLYERLLWLDKSQIDGSRVSSAWERTELGIKELRRLFGSKAGPITTLYNRKRVDRKSFGMEVGRIIKRWNELKKEITPFLMPSKKIQEVLESAGAKTHYSKLGVTPDEFRLALQYAMFIRDRYTVLDLAFALGEIDGWADEIIS